MRIALVHPDLSHKGGSESLAVWTASGLAKRGHDVRVFTAESRPELWPAFADVAALVERVPPLSGGQGDAQLADFPLVVTHGTDALAWAREAPGRRVFYCHEPSRKAWCEVTEAFLVEALGRDDVDRGHPALAQIERNLERQRVPFRGLRRRHRERALLRSADLALANSAYTARVAQRCWRRPFEVLEPGAPVPPVAPARPAAERRGLAVPASANLKKNLYGVLQTLAELARRGVDFEPVEIWGADSDAQRIRDRVAEAGLGDRVRLHGILDDAEAARRLAAARVCLYLPFCEPFGLVAVEALQAGTPLVASNHAGPAEIVEHCGAGVLVDPLRPDRVADALERLLSDGAAYDAELERTAKAAEIARDRYGLDRHVARLEALLGGL